MKFHRTSPILAMVGILGILPTASDADLIVPSMNTPMFWQSHGVGVSANPTFWTGDVQSPAIYRRWLSKHLYFNPTMCLGYSYAFCNDDVLEVKYLPYTPEDIPTDLYIDGGSNWVEKNPTFGEFASDWDREGYVLTGDFDGNGADDFVQIGGKDRDYVSVAYSDKVVDAKAKATQYPYDVRRFFHAEFSGFNLFKKSAVGDFDGDGRKDVVFLGKAQGVAFICFLFGKADRAGFDFRYMKHDINYGPDFSNGTTWGYWDNFSERALFSRVEAKDFDGDGKDDIFITGYKEWGSYAVLFMKGRFAASGAVENVKYSEITVNKPVLLEESYPAQIKPLFFSPEKYNLELHEISFGRYNADNRTDFSLRFYRSSRTYTFLSDGMSGFQLVDDAPANGSLLAGVANPTYSKYNEWVGLFDKVEAEYGARPDGECYDLVGRKGVDGYIECPTHSIYRPGGKVLSGDWNGDGLTDFALLPQVSNFSSISGDFDGTPIDVKRVPQHALMPVALAIGGGRFSVVERSYVGNKQLVDYATRMSLHNKSSMEEFQAPDGSTYTEERYSTDLNIGSEVVVGDFNGDGKDDIALRNTPSSETHWRGGDNFFGCVPVAFSLGDGRFEFHTKPKAAAGWFAYQARGREAILKSGDFNGDGLQDLAIYRKEKNLGGNPRIPIAFSKWGAVTKPDYFPALQAVNFLLND